jgi:hypothetical protein
MADVFDFELHENTTGNLDEDSDDIILDDVSLITFKAKNTILPFSPPLLRYLIDKSKIKLRKNEQKNYKPH